MAKKTVKELPVCESCLQSKQPDEVAWCQRVGYSSLHCYECIHLQDLVMTNPYEKKKGRPKGSKNKPKQT